MAMTANSATSAGATSDALPTAGGPDVGLAGSDALLGALLLVLVALVAHLVRELRSRVRTPPGPASPVPRPRPAVPEARAVIAMLARIGQAVRRERERRAAREFREVPAAVGAGWRRNPKSSSPDARFDAAPEIAGESEGPPGPPCWTCGRAKGPGHVDHR